MVLAHDVVRLFDFVAWGLLRFLREPVRDDVLVAYPVEEADALDVVGLLGADFPDVRVQFFGPLHLERDTKAILADFEDGRVKFEPVLGWQGVPPFKVGAAAVVLNVDDELDSVHNTDCSICATICRIRQSAFNFLPII